jgi:uncharacterized protein (DUF2249 family)
VTGQRARGRGVSCLELARKDSTGTTTLGQASCTDHFPHALPRRHFDPVRRATRMSAGSHSAASGGAAEIRTGPSAGDTPMIVLDARNWEPPKPFEEVMEALCRLQPGERIRLIVGREPLPLYNVLERNGYAWFTMARDDGGFEVDICERTADGG